ncbi:hypothetical protein E2I00_007917 [Balaenoptera physalus]|uniref:Uncharacterized protein n=1 Tax=Balaenoptera physalus TaxID=9770 RepID=A0A643BM45_BALPH|nr:hypothetical protein E2I00_007917 [Balaenoptera physalus]
MPHYPCLLSSSLPHSYFRALLRWKWGERTLPDIFQPRRSRLELLIAQGTSGKVSSPSQRQLQTATTGALPSGVCLIHHLIISHQLQPCGNIKYCKRLRAVVLPRSLREFPRATSGLRVGRGGTVPRPSVRAHGGGTAPRPPSLVAHHLSELPLSGGPPPPPPRLKGKGARAGLRCPWGHAPGVRAPEEHSLPEGTMGNISSIPKA